MIQDIAPFQFHNEYRLKEPGPDSLICLFHGEEMLMKPENGQPAFWKTKELEKTGGECAGSCDYLFSIDDMEFFLFRESLTECISGNDKEKPLLQVGTIGGTAPYIRVPISEFKKIRPMWKAFAAITASQLMHFYREHSFCGRCGQRTQRSEEERAVCCPACGQTVYPKISPAVIVGVTDGDKILVSKYAGREYKRYALLAGFTEIGETLEQTVAREVMEEVGLRVKNITYYKSQPWAFSESLLVGFWAELDGSPRIRLDEKELAAAEWMDAGQLPGKADAYDDISLTREMMDVFCAGRLPGCVL